MLGAKRFLAPTIPTNGGQDAASRSGAKQNRQQAIRASFQLALGLTVNRIQANPSQHCSTI